MSVGLPLLVVVISRAVDGFAKPTPKNLGVIGRSSGTIAFSKTNLRRTPMQAQAKTIETPRPR